MSESQDKTIERLSSHIIKKESGCWIWTGEKSPQGHGLTRVNGRHKVVRKVLYEFSFGAVPNGLRLNHLCDTGENCYPGCRHQACVNPLCLKLVSVADRLRRPTKTKERMRLMALKRIKQKPWTMPTGWNKGLKGTHFSPATELKNGEVKFKGTMNQYKSLHYRIAKMLGKPNKCENCGTTEAKMYHWANVSGKYLEIASDWKRLCVRCHFYFDHQDERLKPV